MNSEPLPVARGVWPKAVPLLVLAGLIAYANSFTKAFVFEDLVGIVNNPNIGNVSRYIDKSDQPVVKLTLWMNYRLGKLNPPAYHAVNLGVHILAGLTLYSLLRRVLLLPRFAGRYDETAPYLAFAMALLWLVHPLHTMAVTYVIHRAESMMGLFYLLAIYTWVRGATGGGRWWYALSVVSFVVSYGCMQVAITLPVVLLVFDRVFLAQSWRELFCQRWLPLATLFALCGLFAIQPAWSGTSNFESRTGGGQGVATTSMQYLLTQSEVILHYLRLAILPIRQAMDYADWPIAQSLGQVWLAFVIVAAMVLGSLVLLYFRPAAGFVGFWFFVVLAPTSSIIPNIDPAFEPRMYLPLISVVIGVVFGTHSLLVKAQLSERTRWFIGAVGLGLAAIVLILLTTVRNKAYDSELAWWQSAAKSRPNNPRPWLALAGLYMNLGDLNKASEAIQRAEELTTSNNFSLLTQKAALAAAAGQTEQAETFYRTLVETSSNRFVGPQLYRNLAWVLVAQGKLDEAARWMRNLVEHQPDVADNYLNLAAVELAAGRAVTAQEAADQAVQLDPDSPQRLAAIARSRVLAADHSTSNYRKAQSLWLAAAACLANQYRDPRMLDTLAMAYAWHERYPEAADAARRGIAAAELLGDSDWVAALRMRLNYYEAGQPYLKSPPATKPK